MTAQPLRKCRARLLAAVALCGAAATAHATGALENPPAGATVSGIAVLSGWHCTARRIEIEIDGGARLPAGSGTDRLDTQGACGRRDTGFSLLFNWGVLPAGTHTLRALADGVEFARRSVTVVDLGGEFLTGRAGTATVYDFPSAGRTTVLEWREGSQSYEVREIRDGAPLLTGRWNGANLERRSSCANAQNNGTRGTYAQYDVSIEGGFLGIQETAVTGLTCTYYGPYRQDGTRREASGTYSCSDGKRGRFTAADFLVTPNALSIRLDVQLEGTETCKVDALLGGSRF